MPANFRPCRHLFTDGHQCGSPALRGEALCFHHHSARRPLHHQTLHGFTSIALPEPLDLHAIQRGLAELLRLTAAGRIDLPLAAALHRQLATASQNLARIERAETRAQARADALHLHRHPVTDYTNHPTLGTIACEPAGAGAPPLDPETSAPTLQTPLDPQTQPQQNEDLETPLKTSPNPVQEPLQEPLPDPVHRFTLPPVIENIQSKEELAAAELHYAQALEHLARGIHARAKARAQLHDQLFPLVDDLKWDQEELEIRPEIHDMIHQWDHPTPIDTNPVILSEA